MPPCHVEVWIIQPLSTGSTDSNSRVQPRVSISSSSSSSPAAPIPFSLSSASLSFLDSSFEAPIFLKTKLIFALESAITSESQVLNVPQSIHHPGDESSAFRHLHAVNKSQLYISGICASIGSSCACSCLPSSKVRTLLHRSSSLLDRLRAPTHLPASWPSSLHEGLASVVGYCPALVYRPLPHRATFPQVRANGRVAHLEVHRRWH